MDLDEKRTQAIRIPVPMWKRGRFWGLIAFAVLLILWEMDARYAGAIFAWFKGAFDWIMGHPIIPCTISLFVGHYCWPENDHLVSLRNHRRSTHVERSESSIETGLRGRDDG